MKMTYRLMGLDCANCAAKMEAAISKLDGVSSASVNFMTTKMVLEAQDDKVNEVLSAAERIIKKIEPQVILKRA
ncbi:MAG: heavy metal transporter [Clostridia bacterium]|nr:heavy metal transporter [Clostridia bacterium]